jgi:hypothetical protein
LRKRRQPAEPLPPAVHRLSKCGSFRLQPCRRLLAPARLEQMFAKHRLGKGGAGPAYADLDTRRGVPAHQLRVPAEMPDVRVAASLGHLRCAERACCHADCWNAEPLMRQLRSSRATKFEIKALACCRACERGESWQARNCCRYGRIQRIGALIPLFRLRGTGRERRADLSSRLAGVNFSGGASLSQTQSERSTE